jgi:hypothetical protein
MTKINIQSPIEFIDKSEFQASVSLNPNFRWAKVIICDDKPNGNGHRVPIEEFDNIEKTGIYSPIKMAFKGERLDHFSAQGKPIGTHAQFSKDGNRLLALVALWPYERPEEIKYLEEMYNSGFPPQISWELSCSEEEESEGVLALRNITLDGSAVVDDPAYQGRTPFVAFASNNENRENEMEKEELETKLSESQTKIVDLEARLAELLESKNTVETELDELRSFRDETIAEKEKVEKLSTIKAKFLDAGLEKSEEFYAEKQETLLSLTDEALDFMIQEMVSLTKVSAELKTELEIPPLSGGGKSKLTPRDLGAKLRDTKS